MLNYHCIIQVPDTFNTSDSDHYVNVLTGNEFDPLFIDPYEEYNYAIDSLSPAKNIGKLVYGKQFPVDILNNNRTEDSGPDLGAYERMERKDED